MDLERFLFNTLAELPKLQPDPQNKCHLFSKEFYYYHYVPLICPAFFLIIIIIIIGQIPEVNSFNVRLQNQVKGMWNFDHHTREEKQQIIPEWWTMRIQTIVTGPRTNEMVTCLYSCSMKLPWSVCQDACKLFRIQTTPMER